MKINEVFGGSYLKAEDLQGRTVRVTISKVEVKEFDDGNKIIVYFQGKDKSLICNKTNASIIQENTGSDETENWIGTTHMLTIKKVEFQGKLVPAIRIVLNDAAPVAPAPAPTPKPVHRVAPQVQVESSGPEEESDSVPF